MAIYVIGANRRYTSEKILEAVVKNRTKDSDNRVFQVITLTSTVDRADYTSTHGFQDAQIHTENGRILEIEYRDEGRLEWITPEFGGRSQAQIPKTPKNMLKLCCSYYDGLWSIDDPMIEAEVQGMAEKMRSEMNEDQLKAEEARIKLLHTTGSGSRIVTPKGTTSDEAAIEEEMRRIEKQEDEVRARRRGLKLQEGKLQPLQERKDKVLKEAAEVNEEEKKLAEKTTKEVREGKVLTKYGKMELSALGVFKLRQIARKEFKIHIADTEKKPEIVDKILDAQEKKVPQEEPEEAMTVR